MVASADRLVYRRGTTLPIAGVGHLIALKVLSESEERLQDRIDHRNSFARHLKQLAAKVGVEQIPWRLR